MKRIYLWFNLTQIISCVLMSFHLPSYNLFNMHYLNWQSIDYTLHHFFGHSNWKIKNIKLHISSAKCWIHSSVFWDKLLPSWCDAVCGYSVHIHGPDPLIFPLAPPSGQTSGTIALLYDHFHWLGVFTVCFKAEQMQKLNSKAWHSIHFWILHQLQINDVFFSCTKAKVKVFKFVK